MGLTVLKKDLKRILEWLLTQLAEEDIAWLSEHRKVFWKDYDEIHPDSWWNMHADFKDEISFRIRDILNAKEKQEKPPDSAWGEGLSRYYVFKTAKLLNIYAGNKNKIELLNEILSKIP